MWRNQSGFSLVEGMVAVAVLGILAVGSASLVNNMAQSQQAMNAKMELYSIQSEVLSLVGSTAICSDSFKGSKFVEAKAKTASGQPVQLTLPSSAVLKAGSPVENSVLNTESLTLTDVADAGINSSGEKIYFANITGAFSVRGSGVLGGKFLKPRQLASVYLTVDGSGAVVGCSNSNPVITAQDAGLMCKAMGGTWAKGACDFGSTTVVAGDPTGGGCTAANKPTCPTGLTASCLIGGSGGMTWACGAASTGSNLCQSPRVWNNVSGSCVLPRN